MPLYAYECPMCGKMKDEFFKIADKPDQLPCSCGGFMVSVITLGHGGIFRDEVTWINDSVRECLQDSDAIRSRKEAPIETRCDLKRYLKAHPNIQPIS